MDHYTFTFENGKCQVLIGEAKGKSSLGRTRHRRDEDDTELVMK